MADKKFRIPGMEINVLEYGEKKIMWDVDPLKFDAKKKEKMTISVDEIFSDENTVDKEWALTHLSNEPIILTKLSDGKYVVLDGKHRLYRAKVCGQKEIEAYFFEESELEKYEL